MLETTEPERHDGAASRFRGRVREALRPRLEAAADEARRSGLPIVRPLVFAFREDPAVADLWDQYPFGADLMVAPAWRRCRFSEARDPLSGSFSEACPPGADHGTLIAAILPATRTSVRSRRWDGVSRGHDGWKSKRF
jgi:hypothetical protein